MGQVPKNITERLFTDEATLAAQVLIEAVAETGLELALPRGTLTHCHSVTKCWSRLTRCSYQNTP